MKKELIQLPPDMSKLPGGVISNIDISLSQGNDCNAWSPMDGVLVIDKLLDSTSVAALRQIGLLQKPAPVSINGLPGCEQIGSKRVTAWVPNVAESLWKVLSRIKENLDIDAKDTTLTDWWQKGNVRKWKAFGISPLFRYMTYSSGGQHCPHYDAGFIYKDPGYRTLKSFVLYLTNNNTGFTRFIDDGQTCPAWLRNHQDWPEMPSENQIIQTIKPWRGRMLIFDHRMCHDVSEYFPEKNETNRIIIRGDIIYKTDE